MNSTEFRKALVKKMPGYKWTVHQSHEPEKYLEATGAQSNGFNRMSTLQAVWRKVGKDETEWYEVKSAGYGMSAPWLAERGGLTLAQALRSLQGHYEYMAQQYASQARTMQEARTKKELI